MMVFEAAIPEAVIIKINMAKSMIDTQAELANRTGMDYQLIRKRLKNPATMKLSEFRAIVSETRMQDEDILKVVKGVM